MNRAITTLLVFCGLITAGFANETGTKSAGEKQVLFVCTGNFYRSRFAEALFNQKARQLHLNWRAISRGLNLVPWQFGISKYAQAELAKRGVAKELMAGGPKHLSQTDVQQSDCIILMDEAEHRAMFKKQFPTASELNLQYWHIPDTGKLQPARACSLMSQNIDRLLVELEK